MEQQNHSKQLLLQLNQQRSKGYLCDVIIVVENALFRAHKNVLAASSVYFKSLVPHDNLINLDTDMVSPSVFRQVLDFIYTGRLSSFDPVNDHSVSSLLTAACYLQLTELAALCRRKLKRNDHTPSSSNKLTPVSSTSPTPNAHPSGPLRLSSTHLRAVHQNRNNHSGSRGANQRAGQEEKLREDLSEEEVFTSGTRCASLSPSGGGRVNGLGLGLDLSKRSPSGSTTTDEVSPSSLTQSSSPHSSSHSPTLPTTAIAKPEPRENQGQPANPSTDTQPRTPCKRPRPHREAFNLGAVRKELPNGLAKGQGEPGGDKLVRDNSVTPKLEDGEVDGEEFGLDQSEDSSHSGSEGGGRGGKGRRNGNANYIYRQPQPGFEPGVGDNLYVCIPCGKGFPSSEQLNAHVDTHAQDEVHPDDEEEDEEAGIYPKEEDLDPDDPADEPQHLCTACGKSCRDAAALRQHEKSHWLNRTFPCNICGKPFTQRGTMTRHMRSHLGLKPFACEECGMRFTRQYRLVEHMRVHSGEKPYACQLCGVKFTQQRNLLSHLKMHASPS
ncbi:hypermethylated in cancer 2 protein [Esox lucius]|uniref:HIC ZBTB transcriptional repressor 2 n=1 Tax=Esox lucius TaxID=8010 RepID=A0A3P8X8N2_ESOLU|nr:hypermethylated in cancer 2 protein [Esox lucius]